MRKRKWIAPVIKNETLTATFDLENALAYGSAYNFFTRDFLHWALKTTPIRSFVDSSDLKDSSAPDEFVWATLNRFPDAPGGLERQIQSVNEISRVIKWQSLAKCMGPRIRNYICVLGIRDIPFLLNDEQFIANKFDDDGDDLVLQCLEAVLHNRTILETIQHRSPYELS